VDIVKRQLTIAERPSSLVRSSEDMAFIAAHCGRVQILQLASFMFFGSAYRLQERIAAMIGEVRPLVVILDFSSVDGIDSSAGSSLRRIHELLRDAKVIQIVVCQSADLRRTMSDSGALNTAVVQYETLDQALEHAEDVLLDHVRSGISGQRSLTAWLTEALGGAERAHHLIKELKPAYYTQDGFLCRTGDPTETLLFIERGRVSVEVERPGLPPLRHRVFGPNTILGEVGFFLGVPRTASLRVDVPATVWSLDMPAFKRLSQHHPSITAALLIYTVRIQGERLAFTSTQVAALQR
jgi:SulP family sulfate permease